MMGGRGRNHAVSRDKSLRYSYRQGDHLHDNFPRQKSPLKQYCLAEQLSNCNYPLLHVALPAFQPHLPSVAPFSQPAGPRSRALNLGDPAYMPVWHSGVTVVWPAFPVRTATTLTATRNNYLLSRYRADTAHYPLQ